VQKSGRMYWRIRKSSAYGQGAQEVAAKCDLHECCGQFPRHFMVRLFQNIRILFFAWQNIRIILLTLKFWMLFFQTLGTTSFVGT
jgi:hypothetical protein